MIRLIAGAALAAALGLAGQAGAAVYAGPSVADASFETPSQGGSGYTYNPSASGVSFVDGAGVQGNGSAWGFQNAPDGVQTAFLQNGGSIYLDVMGLTVGQTYSFSFDLSGRPNYGSNPVSVNYLEGPTDPAFGVFTPADNSWRTYTTAQFTAQDSQGTLIFAGVNASGDNDTGLDNVRVNTVATSAAPEPSTWLLMFAGVGLIGATLRLRRLAQARHGALLAAQA